MATRYGRQTPTFVWGGDYAQTCGGEVCDLFEGYGVKFYPSQRYEMDLFAATDADGDCAAMSIVLTKPRQNGKSFTARHWALWCSAICGRRVLYTAHNGKTTTEMFQFLTNFVLWNDDFFKALKGGERGIRKARGSEAINFDNGGVIEFNTRTNSAARGMTYDVIIVDEAQELTDEQSESMLPTTIASGSGNPQVIYLCTPPNDKCPGTVMRREHRLAHSGEYGDNWWIEWGAQKVPDPLDVDVWYEVCPALGYRIREKNLMKTARKFLNNPDGFAREYLGWWTPIDTPKPPALSAEVWDACKTDTRPIAGDVSFGVKFSTDGTRGCIAGCVTDSEGLGELAFVEVVDVRNISSGVSWFARFLNRQEERVSKVAIDGKSRSAALKEKLTETGEYPLRAVEVCGPAAVVSACAMFADAVESGEIVHAGQPGLRDSAARCSKRLIGKEGGWAFDSNGGSDPLPIEACALAYYAAMTATRSPRGGFRVG